MTQHRRRQRRGALRYVLAGAAVIVAAAATVAVVRHERPDPPATSGPIPVRLPHGPQTYLGIYTTPSPNSYAGVSAFSKATGVKPDVAMYYSSWFEPFRVSFARSAAAHGAVPLVQMEPSNVNLRAIAQGRYDAYLSAYAAAVARYKGPVIMGFGHEMNGSWYSWGHTRSSPGAFVAAWRHIVTLFRSFGAGNVTWLWTINIIDRVHNAIPPPAPWWPGAKYVTWVGIDGYYLKAPWSFAPLFGPTIAAVRQLTHDPILISETGAAPVAGKPAKLANLFAGIRAYGLLGFVWFDAVGAHDWRLSSRDALAAYRRGARAYKSPASR
jgi:hypothetical protein